MAAEPLALEAIFREHRPVLLAALTRVFGPHNLERVEAEVQEACVRALERWPSDGVPDNPVGWLLAVARNRLVDQMRYQGTYTALEPQLEQWTQGLLSASQRAPGPALKGELGDDQLAMLFVACHPAIPIESQVPLALRTLCGFELRQISRALLVEEAALAKRLVRARQALKDVGVSFEVPGAAELRPRLAAVMTVLYALFSEGHRPQHGDAPLDGEVCLEAIRLAEALARHPVGASAELEALLALMCLQASRLPARFDVDRGLLDLSEQDRGRWDRSLMERGLIHLARSAVGTEVTPYHLEAAIAACHAQAPSFDATPWERIAGFYDTLAGLAPSPVVRLNRAIAMGYGRGTSVGLAALDTLSLGGPLDAMIHAARADLLIRAGETSGARAALTEALRLAPTPPEQRFLRRRLAHLGQIAGSQP